MTSISGKTVTLKIDGKVIACDHWKCELTANHPEIVSRDVYGGDKIVSGVQSITGTLLIAGDRQWLNPGSKVVLGIDGVQLKVFIIQISFTLDIDKANSWKTDIEFESTGAPLPRDQLRDLQELIAEVLDE